MPAGPTPATTWSSGRLCIAVDGSGRTRLVEDHQQRREAFGVDQAEDLDVLTRLLAPAGDFQRPLGLGEKTVVADRPIPVLARGVGGVEALFLEPCLADFAQVGLAGDGLVLAQLLELFG